MIKITYFVKFITLHDIKKKERDNNKFITAINCFDILDIYLLHFQKL